MLGFRHLYVRCVRCGTCDDLWIIRRMDKGGTMLSSLLFRQGCASFIGGLANVNVGFVSASERVGTRNDQQRQAQKRTQDTKAHRDGHTDIHHAYIHATSYEQHRLKAMFNVRKSIPPYSIAYTILYLLKTTGCTHASYDSSIGATDATACSSSQTQAPTGGTQNSAGLPLVIAQTKKKKH